MVHSQADLDAAIQASEILFGKGTTETLKQLDERTLLNVFEGVPQVNFSKDTLANTESITDLLAVVAGTLIFPSKGEARKMIQAGGVSINKTKLEDPNLKPQFELLNDKYLLIQKGKKNYYLAIVE